MDTIMVICAFLLMTTAILVMGIRKINKLKEEMNEDISAIGIDVRKLQDWMDSAEDEQEEKKREEKKKQEKESANYLIKFIEPEFQKIIDNSIVSNEAIEKINNIISKIKPIITETAYIELKGKSMKMVSEAEIKKFKELLNCENDTKKRK